MNKKTYIIIGVVTVILVAAICIGGFFLKENKEKNASVGTDWGDIYYDYLGNKFEKGLPGLGELNGYEVQFVPREDDYPIMMVRFGRKLEGNDISVQYGVYFINEEKQVENSTFYNDTNDENEKLRLKLLYNRDEKKYKWYITKNDEIGNHFYYDLEKRVELSELKNELGGYEKANENDTYLRLENEISNLFLKEEMPLEELKEDTAISKFEEHFIEPENVHELKTVKISDVKDLKKIKKELSKAVKEYKPMERVVTEEVKQSVTKTVENIESRKAAIKKKEEEANKGLKVGSYTLKYGAYVGYSPGPNAGVKFILKENGKCEYDGKSCTYTVGRHNFSQDPTPHYKDCLVIKYSKYEMHLYPYNAKRIGDGDIDSYDYKG